MSSAPPEPVSRGTDTVLRAMTDDGAFRVITARTTETVRDATAAQAATGTTARMFGELLTGAVLYRETMAPQLRVQGILRGSNGSGSLVADSHPSGRTRGLVQLEQGKEIDLGDGAIIQMMRTMPGGTAALSTTVARSSSFSSVSATSGMRGAAAAARALSVS